MMFKQFPIARTFILFIVLAGFTSVSNAAYVAPVGIPTPTFCVDDVAPSAPAAWPSSEATGYYYIDNTHPSATNSGNTYGYPNKPRLTIPSTYAAGDYAEIHGGPYTGSRLDITASGTSANPIWVRGFSTATRPTIRQHMRIQGSYINFENLYFDTTAKTMGVSYTNTKAQYICIRNNEFAGPGISSGNNAVLSTSGASGNLTSNIVFYKNLIHDYGDNDRTISENDYHGILPASYSEYIWILDNEIYNMGGDSVQVGQATYAENRRPNYIYIGNNIFHDDRENAIDVKRANHVIASRNTMYNYASSTTSVGEIVVIHNEADNVWVLANTIYNGTNGVVNTSGTNIYVIGNTISDIFHVPGSSWDPNSGYSNGAGVHFRGASTGAIIHNTFYDYDTGIQLTQGGASGYDVQNNIFSERREPTGWDIRVGESDVAAGSTFDYNLIYNSSGEARIGWNSSSSDNVALFRLSTGKCTSCPAEADPKFINPATRNFRIRGGSPAMNAGATNAAYTTFSTRYGISIMEDILGNARLRGPTPEIGAYELDPPAAPTNTGATLLP